MSKQLEKLTEKALRTGFANLNRWETADLIEKLIKEN